MNIILVRHGQTDWNSNNLVQGRTNINLNETGILQASQTAENLSNISIDFVYSSPLSRALKTANIIINNTDIPIKIDDRLIERNYGDYEGSNISIKDYWNYDLNLSNHNVESLSELFNRVYSLLKDLIETYKNMDVNILLVTHDGINISIDCIINGLPKNLLDLRLKNCDYKIFKNVTLETLKIKENKYLKEKTSDE